MANLVIDPVTRIEGHLRLEAELGLDGKTVNKAYSSSTMARAIEVIMQGRDPRDACHISQRICGVCTVVHGLTSVRAVENALKINVPENAELIRNLMIGAQYIHDHVMHFYHLHALDWVDVVSALGADSLTTAKLAKANNPTYYANKTEATLKTDFDAVKAKLKNLLDRGQLGLFANGYWGHPEYKLPPAGNLLAVAHYLDALGWAREVVKLHTIFGGKDPHPNLVVGGVPCSVSSDYNLQLGEDYTGTSINRANMTKVTSLIAKMKAFVDDVYVPDTILIAGFYKSQGSYKGWEKFGGTGGKFLCYGEFPETGIRDPLNFLIPQGVIEGSLAIGKLDLLETGEIKEYVAHSWYKYLNDSNAGLHPSIGQTTPDYTGRGGPIPGTGYKLNTGVGYSWIKSPRWYDKPMEVGPLAHVVMMYAMASGSTPTGQDPAVRAAHLRAKALVDAIWVNQLGLALNDIDSTLGRIAARTIETSVIADAMSRWHERLLVNIDPNKPGFRNNMATFFTEADALPGSPVLASGFDWMDPSTWTLGGSISGVGFTEAPRGALGHWLTIENGKIKNYQCIVASQWNAGPRSPNPQFPSDRSKDIPGPYEKSLEGHVLAVPTQPLEILRTIHSFDPCIGCAVHVTDPNGEELIKVNVSTTLR